MGGVAGAARGLQLFGELPISCNVPLRFGLWGEVLVSSSSKQAFLLFPVTSLMLAVTDQAPRIARNEQQSLLPEGLVMGYLTTLGVIYGAFYYGAKYFAG